ncbi:hypothetical protein PSACC_01433 [Paramicrosporidium saccamoebae]|uniref:snRNA-activating protein complex subunit 3 n=1 Tax=Paramicrosporidium saccamoebae TaxID=1246581 RepID=A0A2H9TLY8_9FUNG|nr:hypothetical protein PSACC_01433 [Paramicrosporidium saccamoebae]
MLIPVLWDLSVLFDLVLDFDSVTGLDLVFDLVLDSVPVLWDLSVLFDLVLGFRSVTGLDLALDSVLGLDPVRGRDLVLDPVLESSSSSSAIVRRRTITIFDTRAQVMNTNEGDVVEPAKLANTWQRTMDTIDHSHVESMLKHFDTNRMTVEREDGHDISLACRLFTAEAKNDAVIGPGHDNEEFERIEDRLSQLERRLASCKMSAMTVYKNALQDKVGLARHSVLSRDILEHSTETLEPNVVLTISVYSSNKPGTRMQTFDVLASVYLTEFRARIACLSERVITRQGHPRSSSPGINVPGADSPTSTEHFLPSYFFIEGAFYSDISNPAARDLSHPIRMWINADPDRRQFFGSYAMRAMHETTWLDVPLRLGRPYSFVHCGRCEHYIVVEQLRLDHPFDHAQLSRWGLPPEERSGIIELYHLRRKRRKCRICDLSYACWVTLNDRLAILRLMLILWMLAMTAFVRATKVTIGWKNIDGSQAPIVSLRIHHASNQNPEHVKCTDEPRVTFRLFDPGSVTEIEFFTAVDSWRTILDDDMRESLSKGWLGILYAYSVDDSSSTCSQQ